MFRVWKKIWKMFMGGIYSDLHTFINNWKLCWIRIIAVSQMNICQVFESLCMKLEMAFWKNHLFDHIKSLWISGTLECSPYSTNFHEHHIYSIMYFELVFEFNIHRRKFIWFYIWCRWGLHMCCHSVHAWIEEAQSF